MLLYRVITKSQNPEHRDPRISILKYHGRIACEVTPAQHVTCDVKSIFAVVMCATDVPNRTTLATSMRACSGYQLHGRATSGRLRRVHYRTCSTSLRASPGL